MLTDRVTWYECITDPKGAVGAIAPIEGITDAMILQIASEAQTKLQEKSRSVHRSISFKSSEIDGDSLSIGIDDDIWRLTEVRKTNNGKFCWFIKVVSLHELRRLIQIGVIVNDPLYGPQRLAVDKRRIYFNIAPQLTEKIHIDYDPFLLPFTPLRAKTPGDWNGCDPKTAGFDQFVNTNGPEAEFWQELPGIKGYTGMKLLQALGSMYIKAHYGMYLDYKGDWEKSLVNVAGNQPYSTVNDKAASYSGPV